MGGVYNWMEVFCNNHRTRCNMNPINALETFNPREDILQDVYIVEKTNTKQGWSVPAADEGWQLWRPRDFQDARNRIYHAGEQLPGIELSRDTIATLYTGYLSVERGGLEVV